MRRHADGGAVRLLERALERRVDLGHQRIEDLFEVEKRVLHLVADPRALLADLLRLPEDGDLLAEGGGGLLRLDGRSATRNVAVEPLEKGGDPAMLVEDGAPLRFRRMRREDQLDARAPEERLGLGAWDPQEIARELRQRSEPRLAGARVVAVAPDAVVLLGEVHDLEVVREGPGHALGRGRLERGDRGA